MGIEKVTTRPERYLEEPEAWEREAAEAREEEAWQQMTAGRFWVTAGLRLSKEALTTQERRDAALLVGEALRKDAVFERREERYKIADWAITADGVVSELYSPKNRIRCRRVFGALDGAGYRPKGEVSIFYRPETFEPESALSLMFFMEGKTKRMEERLDLPGEPRVILHEDAVELCAPMERLEYGKIEGGLLLFEEVIRMTEARQPGAAAG